MLIKVTIFDIPYQSRLLQHLRENGYGNKYNAIPFHSILDILKNNSMESILKQIGGNFILLIPLGIYAPLINKKFANIKSFLMLMLSVSMLIEFVQFLIGFITQYHLE